jgi:hypothetical protein
MLLAILVCFSLRYFYILLVTAVIIAGIIAVVSFRKHPYSFALVSALSGAFLASASVYGLVLRRSVKEIAYAYIHENYKLEWLPIMMVCTAVLGVRGYILQQQKLLKLLKSVEGSSAA